jgi:hypothetical protein
VSVISINSVLRRGIATVLLAALSTGWFNDGPQAASEEEALLIVKGAQHFFPHRRSPTSKQISYTVELAYPERAIGEPEWEQLMKAGWARCRNLDPDREAANADWVSFGDISVTPGRTVHQHLTHWARNNQMIVVSLRYYSKMLGVTSKPDNTEQHVDLIFDDENGQKLAEWHQLDCSR